jgi:hypothetical protein
MSVPEGLFSAVCIVAPLSLRSTTRGSSVESRLNRCHAAAPALGCRS